MPTLSDIMDVANALEGSAIRAIQDRCVLVRNRHSQCSYCVDACIADAVSIVDNTLKVDASACVGCGACTSVCPTGALLSLEPTDEDLDAAIAQAQACDESKGAAVIACARMAARNVGNPSRYAAVSCLGRMEESLLLRAVVRGATDVALVDGNCETCKYRGVVPTIDAAVSSANTLLAAQGCFVRVRRSSTFPDQICASDADEPFGAARRAFFTQAGSVALDAVRVAAEKAVDNALGQKEKPAPTLRERLGATDKGTLPQFTQRRQASVLDAMDALGQSVVPEITTRLFGSVNIDASKCKACEMCTVFCPTHALVKSDEKPEDGVGSYLEFSAADCTQCNLCADACLHDACTVSRGISTAELFSFEPRFIHLPEPPERTSFISRLKGTG